MYKCMHEGGETEATLYTCIILYSIPLCHPLCKQKIEFNVIGVQVQVHSYMGKVYYAWPVEFMSRYNDDNGI